MKGNSSTSYKTATCFNLIFLDNKKNKINEAFLGVKK
jgi:hypothetical protein